MLKSTQICAFSTILYRSFAASPEAHPHAPGQDEQEQLHPVCFPSFLFFSDRYIRNPQYPNINIRITAVAI